jgi:O-antigen ligase
MFASGSRGAWLGLIAAAMTFGWLRLNSRQAKQLFLTGIAASLIAASGIVVLLRDNDFVQNIVFHTDEHSTSKVSSNSAHVAYSIAAAKEIISEPLGRGPGTAGPAGVYNTGHPARIAENYFLQIGQETGWLGLGLFLAIYALLAWELWLRRKLLLAQVLLASLAGLSVMALLMHIWTDDTIAYLWFGLAGILLAQPFERKHAKAD